jgi:hypothetical protein
MEQHWSQSAGAHLTLSASYWLCLRDLTVQGSASNGGSLEASRGSSQEALNGGSQEALNGSDPLRVLGQRWPGSHKVDWDRGSAMMLEPQPPHFRLMCKQVHRQTSSLDHYSSNDCFSRSSLPGPGYFEPERRLPQNSFLWEFLVSSFCTWPTLYTSIPSPVICISSCTTLDTSIL